VHFTTVLDGLQFHGLSTGHLVLYRTGNGIRYGIATRTARDRWVATGSLTLCDCPRLHLQALRQQS